jgi:hypothetical protein
MEGSVAKKVALVFGAGYLAGGILGFLPFVGGTFSFTTPSDLLGLVRVSGLHNLFHVVIGLAGLAAASDVRNSRAYCQLVGIVLMVLAILGLFLQNRLGWFPLGNFDVALHLVSGALLAYFGFFAPVEAGRKAG